MKITFTKLILINVTKIKECFHDILANYLFLLQAKNLTSAPGKDVSGVSQEATNSPGIIASIPELNRSSAATVNDVSAGLTIWHYT